MWPEVCHGEKKEVFRRVQAGSGTAGGSAGPTIALSGVFPADGIWLLADDVGDGTSSVVGAHLIANVDFQNGPDSSVGLDSVNVL